MKKQLIYENTRYVGALDGIRTIAVAIIVFYHYWQLNWLQYYIPRDIFGFLGYKHFSIDWIIRYGYLCVELLFLLSSFLLFLPVARAMLSNSPEKTDWWLYFKKRFARIVPSYLLVIVFSLIFIVRPSDYGNIGNYFRDLFSHLTFTHSFWVDTHIGTKYFGVVWSLSVEVVFYFLFPLIVWFFKKRPLLTYGVMIVAGELYIRLFVMSDINQVRFRALQPMSYISVYANGMLAAYIFAVLAGKIKKTAAAYSVSTVIFIASLFILRYLVKHINADLARESIQMGQVQIRFILSFMYGVIIVSLLFSAPFIRWVFSCGFMRFMAAISYNWFLWHQFIGASLIKLKIPYYPDSAIALYGGPNRAAGEPWQLGWQIGFAVTATLASILVAYLLTVFWEKPMAKIILKKRPVFKKGDLLIWK